jgi:hypothetical protein
MLLLGLYTGLTGDACDGTQHPKPSHSAMPTFTRGNA